MFVKLSKLQDPNMKMCTLVGYPSPLSFTCYASLDLEIDVTDGLVNSAAGVVTGFLPTPDPDDDTYSQKIVLIKFDDERIGKKNTGI